MYPSVYAEKTPHKKAYIFPHSNESVSYLELQADSNRVAHLLQDQCSLQAGDGIAVLMENHPWFFKVIWAAQRSGLYYTPVSTRFLADEVCYIINNSDAKVLFLSQKSLPIIGPSLNKLNNIKHIYCVDESDTLHNFATLSLPITSIHEALEQCLDTPIENEVEGAEMFYSSGTTGQPKGVRMPLSLQPLGTVSDIVKKRMQLHEVHQNAVYLSPAPLYHSAPLRYNMMMMRSGATSIIMDRFDAELALDLIQRYSITHSQWVPTMFVRMLKLPEQIRKQFDLSSMALALHAAAPCPVEIKQQMLTWWGPIIMEYYSGTEANGATNITAQEWLAHPGSVGRPLIGDVKILSEAGQELPSGERGLVYFSGGMDFHYHKDAEKTAQAKAPGGLSTLGDIGYLDNEGYLYLTDRKAYTIISGGVNIYPQEIEDLLLTHPKVGDAAVFGVPDEEFGEQVKAVVEPLAGVTADEALAIELISFCRASLAHLKCPKSIDFELELPRHPTGKLYKRLLKERYSK